MMGLPGVKLRDVRHNKKADLRRPFCCLKIWLITLQQQVLQVQRQQVRLQQQEQKRLQQRVPVQLQQLVRVPVQLQQLVPVRQQEFQQVSRHKRLKQEPAERQREQNVSFLISLGVIKTKL